MSDNSGLIKKIYGMNNRVIDSIISGKYSDADFYAHEIKEMIDRDGDADINSIKNETKEDVLSKILNMPEQPAPVEVKREKKAVKSDTVVNQTPLVAPIPSMNIAGDISVLVVDDNELNLEIAENLLKKEGYRVLLADNARRAITIFANSLENDIQVILTDIQMPGMDGNEMAKEIRSIDHPDAKKIFIIGISAVRNDNQIKAAFASGMNGFIKKPFDMAQFKRIIAGAKI